MINERKTMNKLTKYRVLLFIVALLLSSLFLLYVLTTPNIFNMLPFAIHEFINPNGDFESIFIVMFDIVVAILILLVTYRVLYNFIIKK